MDGGSDGSADSALQSAPRRPLALPGTWGWALGWGAVLALAWWMRTLTPLPLALAGVCALGWTIGARKRPGGWPILVAAALWSAVGVGGGVQLRLHTIASEWPAVLFGVEERAARELRARLDEVVDRGEEAVERVGELVAPRIGGAVGADDFAEAALIRESTGVSALVLYAPDGTPIVWAGEFRGSMPETVTGGAETYVFEESPLFEYLHFTRRLPDGRVAVASVLLESNIEVRGEARPLTEWFGERYGIVPRFSAPEKVRGDAVWDWCAERCILSVSMEALTQERWRARVVERGRWGVAGLWIAALGLLLVRWYRGRERRPEVPVAIGTLALLLLPIAPMAGTDRIFSPLAFVLPAAVDVTLGELLILLVGASLVLLARIPARGIRARIPIALRAAFAGCAVVLVLEVVRRSTSAALLSELGIGGYALLLVVSLALSLLLLPLLLVRLDPPRRPRTTWMAAAAGVLCLALGGAVVAWWSPGDPVPVWAAGAWAAPALLVALFARRSRGARRKLAVWLAAGWIGATAAAPYIWTWHLEERLAEAEQEIARLGVQPDPYLDFLLRQFADQVLFLASEGEQGINLLYRGWISSGLAEEGYEARISIWSDAVPSAELRLSNLRFPRDLLPAGISRARAADDPILQRFTDREEVHYLLLVPLPEGRTVSVVIPPRRSLEGLTPLARFLRPPESEEERVVLSLVPEMLSSGAAAAAPPSDAGDVAWHRTEGGWQSETLIQFPRGVEHAHLTVETPSDARLAIRALLVLVSLGAVLTLLWSVSQTLCGGFWGLPAARWTWARSFRARLTLALFGFFLLPTVALGLIAYGALSREVVNTAAAIARRSLEMAAATPGAPSLSALTARARTDLVLYREGQLAAASAPEILELGLFHAWLPPDVFLTFTRGEETERLERRRLAGTDYLMAYRRFGAPGQVLAAPLPLATGEVANRQAEVADMVLFLALLGGAFSVALALLVGRALSRPIEELSRATARVGAGNLRVRLPEERSDEFGGVYRAFNRMVRRLQQARVELMRETRRTEAIVAEAATGVLALDDRGRVALVNPRASQILGEPIETGRAIPAETPLLAAVAEVVDRLWESRAVEWGEDVEVAGQVIRVRLRRLPAEEGLGGAVLALEDLTAEIRTARVLAWGEMARQVAHEIKNPLTPIKLAVQHIRRAFGDQRPDFADILDRNVEAVLGEIDHLGEIARAFARFGTPAQRAGEVEDVDVGRVAEETLALYRGGVDGIEYHLEVDPGTPRAQARTGELREVLVNLLENARDALRGSGEIRIATRAGGAGFWVHLDITDTGEGIPPELLPRIFDPQFSTRTSGTGLGLAIVRRLVEGWGGEVTADSVPGGGTTIHLRLRAVAGPTAVDEAAE